MNWKSIAIHALLLLVAGIASGIVEPQPASIAPQAMLLSYLLAQCVLHLIFAFIFAHLTFRVENHPFAHALLAVLLSHEAASVLLASLLLYTGEEPPPLQPLPVLAFEYTLLLAALVVGTAVGVRRRRRKLMQSGLVGQAAANP